MDSSNLYVNNSCYAPDFDEKFHPRTVTLVKDKNGFGFTLRHFIVYPPSSVNSDDVKQGSNAEPALSLGQWRSDYRSKPMDTIFIREVKEGSPAHNAGLNKGDRIIAINNHPLTGKPYSDIIHLIRKCGQTLRLLVVPKEDDILQLYFATSAYQPVHREHKQHKYLVPSFRRSSDYTNSFCTQPTYGTYPGKVLNKSKHLSYERTFDEKLLNCPTVDKTQCDSSQTKDLSSSSPLSSVLSYNYDTHPGDDVFNKPLSRMTHSYTECFSEDESNYRRSKDLTNSDLCVVELPPKSKGTVDNRYYDLCHNRASSVFSFASEDNLNYPLYLSDFEKTVRCDNSMAESTDADEKLSAYHLGSQRQNLHPVQETPSSVFKDPRHILDYMTVTQNSVANRGSMGGSSEMRPTCSTDITNNQSPHLDYENQDGEISCDMGDPEALGINLVAQRRYQFESGNLLAESLERMNMYRSELSRMSQPNNARIVSTCAAHFESKSQMPAISPIFGQYNSSMVKSDTFLEESKDHSEDEQFMSSSFNSSDQRNRNKVYSEVPSSLCENSSKSVVNSSNEDDYSPVGTGVVHRRKTVPSSSDVDECHIVRRISYLRATAGDRINIESDLSEEDETSDALSPNKEYRIQKLKSFFGEKTPKVKHALHPSDTDEMDRGIETNVDSTDEQKSIYGWVICKVVSLEGKRSSDRSWRHLWAILRNNILYFLKDRREPSKGSLAADEHVINVKYSIAKVANDYVKRKHVLRLMLFNGTEYLVQTESHVCMMEWLNALQVFSREIAELPEWLKNTSVLEKAAAYEQQIQTGKNKSSGQHHPFRKPVFRHRNPSEQSPSVKTRRASQGDELVLSRIGVLWKDRMVQGWKKVHGSHSSSKEASFGVKLENAPPGVTNEHVPLIVELCVQIVESRGLDLVGIYRVPGNNASVSILTDMVNQGIDDVVLQDARWNDVNIVSSLLKAFFRKLPEPLLTSYLYPKFIQASKIEDPVKRLKTIKHVLYHLPVHYFATLRYLIHHLKKVVEHSALNKMEARNLAIVFGPTLVRTTDNNMVTMVTDMSHQCYLIETMIAYTEWLFEDSGELLPLEMNTQDKRKTHPPSTMQSTALLSNINKLDNLNEDSISHEMFTSLYNTATRHLRHRHKKKDPSNNAKKRSGIIADDIDILDQDPEKTNEPEDPIADISSTEPGNLMDINFGSCSSLISGSSKTKQRSLSKERNHRNGFLSGNAPSPGSEDPNCSKTSHQEDEVVLHSYNELSALAQEKVKNFELETKALLRREGQRTRASIAGPAQVEWEKIQREWQKAKLELEQDDLLDHLADDPSYLSCLLNRGDISPGERRSAGPLNGRSSYALSASTSCVKDFLLSDSKREQPARSLTPEPISHDKTHNEKTVLKQGKFLSTPPRALASDKPSRTKTGDSEITTSISQPSLSASSSKRDGLDCVSSSTSVVSKLTTAVADSADRSVSKSLPDSVLPHEAVAGDLVNLRSDLSPSHVSLPS